MENAHNWNSNVFYKHKMLQVKNGNQLVSISFQTLLYWTCLGVKMKTELYATSVTDISFHFSEPGCYAVTHPLNTFLRPTRKIFLPLTGGSYKPLLPLPSLPPQNQNLTSMSPQPSRTSFLYFPALRKGLQAQHLAIWAHIIATMSHSQLLLALTMLRPNKDNNIHKTHRSLCSWFPISFISQNCSWDMVSFWESLQHSGLKYNLQVTELSTEKTQVFCAIFQEDPGIFPFYLPPRKPSLSSVSSSI